MNVSVEHVAGVLTIVGAATSLVSLVGLHLVPTGLSPIRNAVSQYGISNYRIGYRIATIALGIAGLAGALGVNSGLSGSRSLVVVFLVVFGIARLVISWYPMDDPQSPRTTTGNTHGLIAIVTFVSIGLAAVRLSTVLHSTGQWSGFAPVFEAISWALTAGLVAMLLVRRALSRQRIFGAVERLFYLAMLAFFGALAAALLTASH